MLHAFFIIASLAAGLMIYIFHRAPVTLLHRLMDVSPAGYNQAADGIFQSFYLYHLPDALWAFSLSYALACHDHFSGRKVKLLLPLTVVASFECLQSVMPGLTFDWLDLAVESIACLCAIALIKKLTYAI